MNRQILYSLTFAVLMSSLFPVMGQGLHTEWNLTVGSGWDVSPRVHDLDLDRRDEVISIASGDPPVIYCIEYDGSVKWQADLSGTEGIGVALGDLTGNSRLEVVAACSDPSGSHVWAFDRTGQLLWTYELEGRCTSSPLVADLDWDGRDEVLVCGEGSGLNCIDGATGNLLWTTPKRIPNMNYISVADIGRAGVIDVLWLQNKTGSIWIIDSKSGETKRTLNGTAEVSYFGQVMVGDLESDGYLDLVVSTGEEIYCMDPTSLSIRWQVELQSRYQGALGDVDGDGELEILIPGHGMVVCLEASGDQKYSMPIETGGWMGSISLGDIDGDGFQEVLVADHMTQVIYGLDGNTGYVELSYASDKGGLFNGPDAPCIADGDWDGLVEVYVVTAFEEKSPILSMESDSSGSSHHEWPQLLHDWRGTANHETTLITVPEGLLFLVPLGALALYRRSR